MVTKMIMLAILLVFAAIVAAGCAAMGLDGRADSRQPSADPPADGRWAIAIHGGAGAISRDSPADVRDRYLASLDAALRIGQERLAAGASALDTVEEIVRALEDDPNFNAGRGAVLTAAADFELDASIMDGATLACGGVTGVRVRNPVSLARLVMEETSHVLLGGEGAAAFAAQHGIETIDPDYFETPRRRQQLERALERQRRRSDADQPDAGDHGFDPPPHHRADQIGTVGAVALDMRGNLAAATSTGGRTAKLPGRIGDSPIIGAGNYANNRSAAVSGTGIGEEFIRHAVAYNIAARVEAGATLEEAARHVVFDVLRPGDGGVIAVSRTGEIAMPYSTPGMFRGAADSSGRYEVAIWE